MRSDEWIRKKGYTKQPDGSYKKMKKENKTPKSVTLSDDYRTITLKLMGVPMPKQSVKFNRKTGFAYQPDKFGVRTKDYQDQIARQLPEGFQMFEKEVIIESMTFMFPPLKGFNKGQMELINNGGLIPKLTRPDLPDNLKKLPLDAMSGIVFSDDSLIWKECETSKVYGLGGIIIITLKGK